MCLNSYGVLFTNTITNLSNDYKFIYLILEFFICFFLHSTQFSCDEANNNTVRPGRKNAFKYAVILDYNNIIFLSLPVTQLYFISFPKLIDRFKFPLDILRSLSDVAMTKAKCPAEPVYTLHLCVHL